MGQHASGERKLMPKGRLRVIVEWLVMTASGLITRPFQRSITVWESAACPDLHNHDDRRTSLMIHADK